MLLLLSFQAAQSQQIWLEPRGPDTHPVGAADWDELFKPSQQWDDVASKIDVFGITAGYVLKATAEELTAAAANLAEHNIAISIALQSIAKSPGEACGNQEGYGAVTDSAGAAAKLHRLGIKVQYIELDEPLWFGHLSPDPLSCKLTLPELAQRVSLNVNEYLRFSPDAVIGDIEPVPTVNMQQNWEEVTQSFYSHLEASIGKPIAFLHTDVAWRNPGWEAALRSVAAFSHSTKRRFGVIYNGDGQDADGVSWVSDATGHYEDFESNNRLIPDEALFETWDPHPTHVLPETAEGTLSHVMRSYLRSRVFVSIRQHVFGIRGTVDTDHGNPLGHVNVILERMGQDRTKDLPVRAVNGYVPDDARSAIIGIRVNTECFCTGLNDLLIGNIIYAENDRAEKTQFNLADEFKRQKAQPSDRLQSEIETVGNGAAVHMVVKPDQHFGINSSAFAVTPGASFRFQVALGSPSATGMFGSIVIIWLDQSGKGVLRTAVSLAPQDDTSEIARTVTNQDGNFQFPAINTGTGAIFRVISEGNSDFRRAIHEIR